MVFAVVEQLNSKLEANVEPTVNGEHDQHSSPKSLGDYLH